MCMRVKSAPAPSQQSTPRQPSPATGLLFLTGSLGFFYALIAIVDPLL